MTAHRKAMDTKVTQKAVFCLNNYGLVHRNVELVDGFSDFADSMLFDEDVSNEMIAKRPHALRRGRIITDSELLEGDSAGTPEEDDDTGVEDEGAEIIWMLPRELTLKPKATKLDASLEGNLIFMRWPGSTPRHLAYCTLAPA